MSDSFCVGDWLVEPLLLRMSRNGTVKKIEPQLMLVLHQLASNPGEVVTKEHLKETAWRDVIVTENVLTRAISSLRKVLEDDRSNPKYIETISKTGYRLIATVEQTETSKTKEIIIAGRRKKPIILAISIILVIIFSVFAASSILRPIPAEKHYHPLGLANYSNAEYWPAISPDGKFVAYGWKGVANDNWDIYAKLIGTEKILRITDNEAAELRAKWSADGNYIYYIRYEKEGNTIYKKSVFGEAEIRILSTPKYSFGDFDISADEKWISFNDREDEFSPLRLKLISLETGVEKWLTAPKKGFNGDIHPTFSPDGKQVGFIREKNSASMKLWVYDLDSEKTEPITSEHLSINGFDWSKDGKGFVYGSDKSGLYKLWEVSLHSKKSSMIPAGDYQMVMPRVAQTGRVIYAKMKDNVNIWAYNLENKTAEIWRSTNDLNLNPVFSPNGKKVCFTENKNHNFQIWVSDLDGTNAIPITNFIGEYLNTPRWSSDSKSIIFQGFLNGQADIYKVNALGGVPENLTNSSADDHTPFLSQSNKIYFSSNRSDEWGIWRMDIDGSNMEQIIEGNVYAPQLNLDETTIYFCKKGEMGLWAYDLEKRVEYLLIQAFHPMYWGAFAVAKSGIYYLNIENKQFEYFDLDSNQSSLVYKPKARIPRLGITLNLSPDSKTLLFSQIDNHDSDIMLLEE